MVWILFLLWAVSGACFMALPAAMQTWRDYKLASQDYKALTMRWVMIGCTAWIIGVLVLSAYLDPSPC